MPIYVGVPMWPFRGWTMCHMFAATPGQIDYLHEMARQIGLHRFWFQDRPSLPHYDISESKRKLAVDLGAIALETIEDEARILEIVMPRFRKSVARIANE